MMKMRRGPPIAARHRPMHGTAAPLPSAHLVRFVRELLEVEVGIALVPLRLDDDGLILVRQLPRFCRVLVRLRSAQALTPRISCATRSETSMLGMQVQDSPASHTNERSAFKRSAFKRSAGIPQGHRPKLT